METSCPKCAGPLSALHEYREGLYYCNNAVCERFSVVVVSLTNPSFTGSHNKVPEGSDWEWPDMA